MFQPASTPGEVQTKHRLLIWLSTGIPTPTQAHATDKTTHIKFFQLNLQHSRVATHNLVKLTAEQGTDILLLQEPYTIQNKIVGIPKRQNIYPRGKQTKGSHCSY
jgi:hypothetical protein